MPKDQIYAPDGRTWYDTAIDEAAKRGRMTGALVQIRAVCEDNPNMATNFIDEVARIALDVTAAVSQGKEA